MSEKLTKALTLGVVGLLGLAGCSGSEPNAQSQSESPPGDSATADDAAAPGPSVDATSPSGSPATLEVLHATTPNLDEEHWAGLEDLFEQAHPGIDVQMVDVGGGGMAAGIRPLIASGNTPDVVYGFPGNGNNYELLRPLTDQPWLGDSLPMPEGWLIDGDIYAAAVGYQPQSLVFYNVADFEEAGITEEPGTLEELNTVMQKLDEAGITPYQPAGTQLIGPQILMLAYASLFGPDPQWYASVNEGTATVAESALGDVVRAFDSWIDAGYVNEEAATIPYADAQTAFIDGTGAMFPMGSWFAAGMDDDTAEQFGVFPSPTVGEVEGMPVAASRGTWAIFKNAQAVDAALAFVEFMTTNHDAISYQLAADGDFSTLVSYDQNPLQQEIQEILDSATVVTDCCGGSGLKNVAPSLGGEMSKQAQDLLFDSNAEQFLSELQTYWDQNKQ